MTTMSLSYRMIDCPRPWQNFIRDLQEKHGHFGRDISMRLLNRELGQLNAHYRRAGQDFFDYIEFDSERDMTFFMLKYS